MYTGIIIEESLVDKGILKRFRILETKVEEVTERHRTPWLKKWTLDTVEVPDADAQADAMLLSKEITVAHGNAWYADYKNGKTHYVIFHGKVFRIDRSNPKEYTVVKRYGMLVGIPEYQLDFSPKVK